MLLAAACAPSPSPEITYFHPTWAYSFRHPPRWTFEDAELEGVRYGFFRSPPTQTTRAGAVSVTLLGQPLGEEQSLEDFAAFYVDGREVRSVQDLERSGARGRRWELASPDGATLSALLVVEESGHVMGLHVGGETARFEELRPAIDEMLASFTLERPGRYPELRDETYRFSLRIPPSWQEGSHFSRGDRQFRQYTSPVVAVDPGPQTVHASLTISVEPIPEGGDLDAFYALIKARTADSHNLLAHDEWSGGYVDVLRSETAMTVSRLRRYYRAAEGRGYTLSCEAREDVQHRIFRWCDMIAATFRVGDEIEEGS